jgi:hypothetical protein
MLRGRDDDSVVAYERQLERRGIGVMVATLPVVGGGFWEDDLGYMANWIGGAQRARIVSLANATCLPFWNSAAACWDVRPAYVTT